MFRPKDVISIIMPQCSIDSSQIASDRRPAATPLAQSHWPATSCRIALGHVTSQSIDCKNVR